MHPLILQQLTADHINEMIAKADDRRQARQARRALCGGLGLVGVVVADGQRICQCRRDLLLLGTRRVR
jgi:hypothetical protein